MPRLSCLCLAQKWTMWKLNSTASSFLTILTWKGHVGVGKASLCSSTICPYYSTNPTDALYIIVTMQTKIYSTIWSSTINWSPSLLHPYYHHHQVDFNHDKHWPCGTMAAQFTQHHTIVTFALQTRWFWCKQADTAVLWIKYTNCSVRGHEFCRDSRRALARSFSSLCLLVTTSLSLSCFPQATCSLSIAPVLA